MSISNDQAQLIKEEEEILSQTIKSLHAQSIRTSERLQIESIRARDLTSDLVAATREEDKAMLASDEAVSHMLRDQRRDDLESLTKQIEKPYFARIVLKEEDEKSGSVKTIEYKLGSAANPDCRIIDWRKAPISKLYYEYKEGDEYSEEILGRERVGTVALRNRVEIERSVLTGVTNRLGHFSWNKNKGEWESTSASSGRVKSAGSLPDILSLITAEQFRSITEDATTAILIQGIAGSGKTTVAMHRLSWLLHEKQGGFDPAEVTFLVLNPVLKNYVINSLPAAGISGVSVRTYHEWCARTLKWIADDQNFTVARPLEPCPHSIERVKRSMALLKAIEHYVARQEDRSYRATWKDIQGDLLTILNHPQWILDHDETRLLDAEIIKAAYERTKKLFQESLLDWADDALLIRLFQAKVGSVITEKGSLGKYKHIVVDEVQDFSPIELATIIGAVSEVKNITLVGDTSQNLDRTQSFPGWDKLLKHWNLTSEISKYVQLNVSHRSTLPIMRLAQHVQNDSKQITGRQGRTPIWFQCGDEASGIGAAIKWLTKANELYPNGLTAVLCADVAEAKFAYRMLSPTFGASVRLGDAYSFSFEEGIVVTDINRVKGLEFFSVLLWNPSSKNFSNSPLSRNLLYVGITRAEENLSIVTWDRPTAILPPFGRSNLIRSVDLIVPPEENE